MMQRLKPSQTNLRRFAVSPRNRVLSSPKFDLNKISTQQEQRVRNYIYKKSNLLGKGFSSKVYKAYKSEQLYRPYAIKVIDLASLNYDQRKNLELELKIHKGLSHPNIVKCHQTFKTTSAYYLALQYCQHGTLSQYLKSHKRLDQSSVINIISQIVQSYYYLIDLKILHRDLKPQNVMRKDNVWKIADFGFCCKIDEQIFEDDLNVGTPLYMPFQSLVKNLYSHKSDIYSIGVMTYKMLVGSTPWKCNTQKQLIQLMTNQKIAFPQTKNRYLSEFLKKSLQLDYQKRLGVQEFKQLFKKIKQEELQLQRQYQLGSQLKKFQSSRSITTTESISSSNFDKMTPRQMSFNSSFNSSTENNLRSQKLQFIENSLIIASQLESCRLIHHMLLNIDSFIVSDSIQNPESGYEIHCNTKEVLVTFFYKYVLKKVRMLNSYFSNNITDNQEEELKFLGIKDWKQFKSSNQFVLVAKLIKERMEFYEAQFLQSYIKKSILTIRFINKKFPELSQNNVPLGSKFYKNFLDFIKPQIQSLNSYILENLQRAKIVNKFMKKDRILALSYWTRLYIDFVEKLKFLQEVQNFYEKNFSLQPHSGSQNNKLAENLAASTKIQKLQSIKKFVKIQYLYNFKETTLEFKQVLTLRKKLSEVFELSN